MSLSGGGLERYEHIPGVPPEVVLDEVVRESVIYREALRKRGIEESAGCASTPGRPAAGARTTAADG